MKYIKLFNEELNPSTYVNAAVKLKDYKHYDRAHNLENWALEVKSKEHNKKVKDLRDKLSERGTFDCSIHSNIDEIFTGKFYIDFEVDEYSFIDNASYAFIGKDYNRGEKIDSILNDEDVKYRYEHNVGIPIWLGFMPVDDETLKGVEDLNLGDNLYINSYGVIYSMSIDLGLTSTDRNANKDWNIYFNPEQSYLVFDTQDCYDVLFSDRRNAIKFKRLFIDMITKKSELSDAIKKAIDRAIKDDLVPNDAYERIANSISARFSINKFYRD